MKIIEELNQMPLVTVEQILRFKNSAIEQIKELELQNGLLKISLDNETKLLRSCEKALTDRDNRISVLRHMVKEC